METWIEHYRWQGIEHFYLIDNDSNDKPLEILQKYIDIGLVSYYFCPEKQSQVQHYKNIYNTANIKNKTKWLIITDIDEFWYSKNDKLINIIDNYNNYDIIYANWLMFGRCNSILHPIDIRLNSIYREPNLHILTKYIIKTDNINRYNEVDIS
jgi:hypothetical protein